MEVSNQNGYPDERGEPNFEERNPVAHFGG
jgi:hypothetical protein